MLERLPGKFLKTGEKHGNRKNLVISAVNLGFAAGRKIPMDWEIAVGQKFPGKLEIALEQKLVQK